jgi:hypothetical protein
METIMTIDQMIESLIRAKKELGGDEELRLHINCNGKGDFVDIDNLEYSKIFGLSCDVKAPWWAYEGSER